MLQKVYSYLETSKLKYLVFWLILFIFSAASTNWIYSGPSELFTVSAIKSTQQIFVAFMLIDFLLPVFLNKGKKVAFTLSLLFILLLSHTICMAIIKYHLEITYPSTYVNYLKRFSDLSLFGRVTHVNEFITKSLSLLYPAFLLLALKLYNDKQQLLKLNEQKKTAELTALKNQLNPHFLFNTLNNLYSLALKKSDDTTKVIQKLSNILDYILYRCNDNYVSLDKEIDLIENYLSLEKIRYGDRVHISFSKNVSGEEKIAPLLLLTFIENAFKHGVTNEIKQAVIEINISKKNEQLIFSVVNSKPQGVEIKKDKKSIGLTNIKNQLELLYPKAYDLIIKNKSNSYSANLKLDII